MYIWAQQILAPPTYPPGGIPHMDEMSDGKLLQVDNGHYMQPDIYKELSGNLSKPSLHLQAPQPAGRGMFHQEERQKYRSWEKWKLAASPETSCYFVILWGHGGVVEDTSVLLPEKPLSVQLWYLGNWGFYSQS